MKRNVYIIARFLFFLLTYSNYFNCASPMKYDLKKRNITTSITSKCKFRGKVVEILLSKNFAANTRIISDDPQFILQIDSVRILEGEFDDITNGNIRFAIHSPTKTFALQQNDIINKCFVFELFEIRSSQSDHIFYELEVVRQGIDGMKKY